MRNNSSFPFQKLRPEKERKIPYLTNKMWDFHDDDNVDEINGRELSYLEEGMVRNLFPFFFSFFIYKSDYNEC